MKIVVQNFQSLGHVELEATGLTVIVGPSDRGKSALLRAIEGALFNRPGDQFVRTGARQAEVSITFDNGDNVTWKKGGGVNQYAIRGDVFARVGQKAPDPLQAMGFKDVLIGARMKEDGKTEGGEWVRPQVHHQFDPIFLLDAPGPFVNEVLVKVSRLGVLQTAGRQCALDLRQAKQLLRTRQGDLEKHEAELLRLEPVVALKARVDALRERSASWRAGVTTGNQLRDLVRVRRDIREVLARPLPDPGPRSSARLDSYQALAPLVARRTALRALPPLPLLRTVPEATVQRLRLAQTLRPLLIEQRQHRNWVAQYRDESERHVQDHARLTQELEAMKATLGVCPICERPFAKVKAAVA